MRKRTCSVWRPQWTLTLALLVAVPVLAAAPPNPHPLPSGSAAWKGRARRGGPRLGPGAYRFFGPNGSSSSAAVGPLAQHDVIVALRELPLSETVRHHVRRRRAPRTRSRGRLPAAVGAAFERLKAGHRRFRDSLHTAAEKAELTHPGSLAGTHVRREYLRAFNGVALSAPDAVIERLRRHPDVAAIHVDRRVQASLEETVPLIGAPVLWSEGFTGQGVTVGIIDTGVDYSHPDLGGGIGPGFKVIGGYDFVNGDADPMDDGEHGTHVAGIVAANGSIKGVAPDAQLVAYKVLDSMGGGWDSDVIAAIERATDPDGDPMTDDALDVINLSLGGAGDPDDPVSQAVDRAFDSGVLVIVSAGNDGDAYSTIGSPACARKALAVGATDKSDQIALSSSRGPAPLTFALKPDVVAPGVDVNSSVPGASYATHSGTSMAAPHVTGAAALLLQRDPTLSPSALKSMLMSSARDAGADPFVQGSGRIDVAAAARVTTVVDPPSVSFGLADSRQPGFFGSETVTVTNRGSTAREYTVDVVADGVPDGLVAIANPARLVLAPGESGELTLELFLDNARVPKIPRPPYAYGGVVRVADATEEIEIPFSILKGPMLRLSFDVGPTLVVVFDEQGGVWTYPFPGPELSQLLPEASYNVLAMFDEFDFPAGDSDELPTGARHRVVLREALAVDTPHTIRRDEATHRASFDLVDEDGGAVAPNLVLWTFRPGDDLFAVEGWAYPLGELSFSDIDERFRVDWLIQGSRTEDPAALYTVARRERGISSDVTFGNEPRELRRVELDIDPFLPPEKLGEITSTLVRSFGDWTTEIVSYAQQPVPRRLAHYAWIDPAPDAITLGFHVDLLAPADPSQPWNSREVYETPVFRPHGRVTDLLSLGRADPAWDERRPMKTTRATVFPVGLAPHSWFGKLSNTPTQIQPLSSLGGASWLFVDQAMCHAASWLMPYELYEGDTLVDSGAWGGLSFVQPWPLSVVPGAHTLTVRGPWDAVAGIGTQPRVDLTFDTTAPDPNPPYLSHFGITTIKGRPVKSVHFGQPVEVHFKAYDDVRLESVRLLFRVGPDGPWVRLPLRRSGGLYRAWLPTWVKPPRDGELPISLRIEADDAQGNTLTHLLEPAVGLTLQSPHLPTP